MLPGRQSKSAQKDLMPENHLGTRGLVVGYEDDLDPVFDIRVAIDQTGNFVDELDRRLGFEIAGAALAAKIYVRGWMSKAGLSLIWKYVDRISNAFSSWRLYSWRRLIWTSKNRIRIDLDPFVFQDIISQFLFALAFDFQKLVHDRIIRCIFFQILEGFQTGDPGITASQSVSRPASSGLHVLSSGGG
jgi:hypothetical protein